jgi:hypothetical protein
MLFACCLLFVVPFGKLRAGSLGWWLSLPKPAQGRLLGLVVELAETSSGRVVVCSCTEDVKNALHSYARCLGKNL